MTRASFAQRFGLSFTHDGKMSRLTLQSTGLALTDPAGVRVNLLPCVCIDGVWHSASPEQIKSRDDTLTIAVADLGVLTVEREGDLFALRFDAQVACAVDALGFEGTGHVEGAHAFLSNGFQSWSQSGVLALSAGSSKEATEVALRMHGDLEMIRGGSELSWWYTVVAGATQTLLLGALTARRFRTHLTVARTGSGLTLRLISGASGERVALAAGQTIESECYGIDASDDAPAMLRRYGALLPSRRPRFPRMPQAGWMSWYELWDEGLNAKAVYENAERARPLLARLMGPHPARPHLIVDDGWQKNWGDWEPNEKFSEGLDGLSRNLDAKGFATGVWLAPFLAHERSQVVRDHPDWFVKDAVYMHAKRGRMLVLDVTHQDAQAHLTSVIRRIVSWGYAYLKIDFLFAGTFEGKRKEQVTGMEAYERGMATIRAAAGEDVFILAVGAPVLGTFPHVDAYRVGFDIAIEALGSTEIGPSWVFVANQARSLAARFFLSEATLLDVDPTLLRKLSRTEVDSAALLAALAGGALFLSDDLRKLPEERAHWGLSPQLSLHALSALASAPESIVPRDPPPSLGNPVMEHLMGRNEQHVPLVWRMPDGRRVALNVSDQPQEVAGHQVAAHSALWLAP